MNAKIALTSLVLAAGFAGSAFAESPLVGNDPFSSSRTRAEVQAELAAYKQAGVNPWSTSYNPLRSFRSAATREAVVAEYLASRGEVRALTGEDSGSHFLAQRQVPAGGTVIANTAR
ncbi:MAG TPA: DUF4148 domain-containing protein [Ramlibacter sp.]|nr:DUF4148 domain-containing protein [Ramlibacter sp.]